MIPTAKKHCIEKTINLQSKPFIIDQRVIYFGLPLSEVGC